MGFDTHMILEAVPAPHCLRRILSCAG